MNQKFQINRCSVRDLPELRTLLSANDLPVDDVDESLVPGLLVARVDGEIVGAVGLQRAGPSGLLRSLVVADPWRGRRLAAALVVALESSAREREVARLYLLTTTAEEYFRRRGYVTADRSDVPAAIAAFTEFRELCPASAVCLTKALSSGPTVTRAGEPDDRADV